MPKRICAICESNNKSGEIYVFDELLRELGIEGRHAHPTCVMDEQAKLRTYIKRHGVSPNGL